MWVLYSGSVAPVDLDQAPSYWHIAETAAIKHLGKTLLDARLGAGALSLRGPISSGTRAAALTALSRLGDTDLTTMVNPALRDKWFLLGLDLSISGRTAE